VPLRYQPPVSSPIDLGALVRAGGAAVSGGEGAAERVGAMLRQRYGAGSVALTSSGTAALVVALRAVLPRRGIVALPAYACVDLVAAAIRAEARVRLYDIDPSTLGPDLDSLRRALERGADAVVVAHLYGYPADVAGVRTLAEAAGAQVIEDAAQQAGARLGGVPVGSSGPVTVLSFGRGKGTTGGRGGAVFATAGAGPVLAASIDAWQQGPGAGASPAGWGDLGRAGAQWAFGRPALYGIPASIPALGIGETVYHAAGEPGRLSRAAAALVEAAFRRVDEDRTARAARAAWYVERLTGLPSVRLVRPVSGAEPGYLRFPILDATPGSSVRNAAARLGVVRTYPRPLGSELAIASVLEAGEPVMPGAREICDRLLTLPTHAAISDADAARVVQWAKR
jgi:dTDP-4-amino-4,6-dideoxygalactose transaminase